MKWKSSFIRKQRFRTSIWATLLFNRRTGGPRPSPGGAQREQVTQGPCRWWGLAQEAPFYLIYMMGLDFIWEKVSATKCNKGEKPPCARPTYRCSGRLTKLAQVTSGGVWRAPWFLFLWRSRWEWELGFMLCAQHKSLSIYGCESGD